MTALCPALSHSQEGICVILVHEPKKAFYKKARTRERVANPRLRRM